MLTLGHILYYFAFVLVSISLVQGWRVQVTFSIKIIVFWPPKLEFCSLRKTKQNLEPDFFKNDLQVFWSNSLNVYSNAIVHLL